MIAFADDSDPYVAVTDALTARGLAAGQIGVDYDSHGFTTATTSRLGRLLPRAQFADLGPVSDTLRTCKFSGEIATLRRAAAIADATMTVLAAEIRPGLRVRDAAAIAAAAMLRLGADDGGPGPILRSGGDIDFLHGVGLDDVLADGDVLHAPSPMWPDPAIWTDVGKFTLLVCTQDGVPTWEVHHRVNARSSSRNDLIADGTADMFEAAKAAALFEASGRSSE